MELVGSVEKVFALPVCTKVDHVQAFPDPEV